MSASHRVCSCIRVPAKDCRRQVCQMLVYIYDEMCAHTHAVLDIMNRFAWSSLSVCAMAAVQPLFCSGRAAAACFGRSAAVANVRAMVKQGGSETAENDGSKLVNVAHP